jgi:hypothetical protein
MTKFLAFTSGIAVVDCILRHWQANQGRPFTGAIPAEIYGANQVSIPYFEAKDVDLE